jgi:NADPH:quinone reductase-like Zn-dependent oxidoreductase
MRTRSWSGCARRPCTSATASSYGARRGSCDWPPACSSRVSTPKHQDLVDLTELIDSGKVTPVIDRTYPLAETPAALRHIETGHARGKVVITVSAQPGA